MCFLFWTVSEHLRASLASSCLLCNALSLPLLYSYQPQIQDCVILCLVSKVFQAPILNYQRFLNFLLASININLFFFLSVSCPDTES